MKTIKFNKKTYSLVNDLNVTATYLQATIEKGNYTFDSIISDTANCSKITVYEDEEVVAVYEGYTKRIAISINGDDYISVELANTDIVATVDTLYTTQQTQATAIETISSDVSSLNSDVDALFESQSTQDLAIEDLGEAVSELAEG